jgi:hypothetical protein
MATRVNIVVDIGDLKEKSRAQILAGRASLTRKEEEIKTEIVARKKRTEERIKQGLDPVTGQKIGSSDGSIVTAGARGIAGYRGSSGPRVDEEPGARGSSGGNLDISVIDEDSGYSSSREEDWTEYRRLFPSNYFFLLVPEPPSDGIQFPQAFLSDSRAFVIPVNRQGSGDPPSDWLSLIREKVPIRPRRIHLVIDDSGSMTFQTVRESSTIFYEKVVNSAVFLPIDAPDYRQKMEPVENWIVPHILVKRN